MGQKQTSELSQQSASINHLKFANPTFLKDPNTDEEYFQITVPVVNEKQYTVWAAKLKQKNSPLIRTESLMLPRGHSFKKEGLCGSSGFANIDYDNFPFLLKDQIANRESINHKLFEENELWYLLFTLVTTAKDFHRRGLKVGDIRPGNIFINEDGQVKMATQFSWPGEQVNYSKTFYQKEITYLSPEQIKQINFGKSESSISPDSSEAFAIGLTCLDAALLDSSVPLFSKNNKFDFNKLDDKIRELRGSEYSELLCLVIGNLCETQPEDRCTCNQIYEWLIPHEEAINNLEDFQVNMLPDKVDRTKNKLFSQPLMPTQHNQQFRESNQQFRQIVQQPPQQIYQSIQGIPFGIPGGIPPGAQVRTGAPMTLQQVLAHQRGQYVPGQPMVQAPSQPIPGQFVPPVNIPMSASNYTHGPGGSQVGQRVYQNMPPPHQIVQNQQIGVQRNTQVQYATKIEQVSQREVPFSQTTLKQEYESPDRKNGQYNNTLQKIDEQLQRSRKMFPS